MNLKDTLRAIFLPVVLVVHLCMIPAAVLLDLRECFRNRRIGETVYNGHGIG